METVVAVASVAGTVFSAVGQIMQSQQAAANAQAQANAARYNAQVQENNAKIARDQAAVREEQQRRHFAALQGKGIAAAAQSGAGLEGSNLDVLQQNAVLNELDALTIRYEGQIGAQSREAQAGLLRYNARVYDMNASNPLMGGYVGAGTSLLTGFGRMANYGYGGLASGSASAGYPKVG